MDFTELADPATLTKLLTGIFGVKIGSGIAAFLAWQGLARTLLVPLRKKIQRLAEAVMDFAHRDGNTEILTKLEKARSKTIIKVMCFILNYTLSIKLGPELSFGDDKKISQ